MNALLAPWNLIWNTPKGALAMALIFLVAMLATFLWTGPLLGLPAIGFSARWKLLERQRVKETAVKR